jgi:peptidyl-prolyl cis-trans isomerase A (cyclophilin A)
MLVPRYETHPGSMRQVFSRQYARRLPILFACLLAAPAAFAIDVRLCTAEGAIDVELDEQNAPANAANFARYVQDGFYSGTVIHRVVSGSMIQGGSYNLALERRRPNGPVANESRNGLSNLRGTIAASRGDDPDSATSQFFFNLSDNVHLDATRDAPGFTVFGHVTAGLDALDRIAELPTRRSGDLEELPVPLVELQSVTTLGRAALFGLSVETDPEQLQSDFDAALIRSDATATLAAVNELRRGCIGLNSRQYLAEAEAAIELGRFDRARYSLEQYLARANTADPLQPRAQRLLAGLPEPRRPNNIDELLAHCQRPAAPSIPDGRFAEMQTMQAIEIAVLRYRQLGQLYIACVAQVLDRGELNEAETIDATERHNQMVVELTAVLSRFNQSVRAFKNSP